MISKQINDPNSGVDENFISCINTHSDVLNDGDVVIFDFSSAANALKQGVLPVAGALNTHVAGVVTEPSGQDIAVGAVCKVMTRGVHKAVKRKTGAGTTIGDPVGTSGTAKQLLKIAAPTTTPAGAVLGYAAETVLTGATTMIVRVDVK